MHDHCDFLVVGGGPAGVIAANTLADSGKKVVLIEAGPYLRPEDYHDDAGRTLADYFWDGGMRSSRGNAMLATLQAKCLGGGSVFNAAICMRALPSVLESWASDLGLQGLGEAELAPHFEAVEQFMGVRATAAHAQGRRNELFRDGCAALGWRAEPIRRNEGGCVGSGNCMVGCKGAGKNSTDRRGVPELIAKGGVVYTSLQADRVLYRSGRVAGIAGYTINPTTKAKVHPSRITADCTILSAGVIANPLLLQRAGLSSDQIGANLRMHPSGLMFGLFDQDVEPWLGATQGYHCLEFLESEGIKLESLWASASLLALRFPGMGKSYKRYIKKYKRMAVFDAWISSDDSVGRVRALPAGQADIQYDIGPGDLRRLQEANAKLAELFAAAGASEVLTGIHGLPPMMAPLEAAAQIREARLKPADFPTGSNHVYGSLSMGVEPANSATDAWGKLHGVDDLYIADTSLFPTSPGVNPMLTAMALAHRLGRELPSRYPSALAGG